MIRVRIAVLFSLFLFLASALYGQKPADLKKNGERYFANRRWQDALTALSQYQQEKPGDADVLTKLGICHYQLHQADKARQYLEFVLNQHPKNSNPDLHYYLARTLHGQQEFEKAITTYKNYLRFAPDKHPLRANAADNIKRCVSGMAAKPNDAVALVENLGDRINSSGDEFAPIPSVNHPDRIYFSAARDGCAGGLRNAEGYEDNEKGAWCSDIFFSQLYTGGWDAAKPLSGLINTSRNEVALAFNPKGQILYYFRGFNLFGGEIFADTAGAKDEYALNPPPFKSPLKAEAGDCAPFFFNDTTLLFASRRSGGQGGLDLYITTLRDTGWAAPQNLGPAVNSAYDETTPFLARDGRTLYFSSNHTGSMGGLDVFRARFDDKKQEWTRPEPLGTPVNSPGDDAFFQVSPDGQTAYFASDRLDSYGERDIYIVYYKEQQAEQSTVSTPALFLDAARTAPVPGETEISEKITLSPLFYTDDKDVLNNDNKKIIENLAAAARNYPEATVVITTHTDVTGPAKFDLYYGIKRAEIVGKALGDKGVPASRIVLKSCGPAYPVAVNVIDASPNPAGQRLNRRIEVQLATTGATTPNIEYQRPQVSELMAAEGGAQYAKTTEGLGYRVEIATTRQILSSDALAMFSDILIESKAGSGAYQYTAGFFRQYAQAVQLRKELQAQGFKDAAVVAYLNGIRISKAEAVALVKKYPDLSNYLKG